jgi:hypothetical protein
VICGKPSSRALREIADAILPRLDPDGAGAAVHRRYDD